MPANRFYTLIMLSVIGVLLYLNYQVFQPFLTSIAWALVFCVVFYPAYIFILKRVRIKALASLLTLLLIMAVIIGPFSYLAIDIVNEIQELIGTTETGSIEDLRSLLSDERVKDIAARVQPYIGMKGATAEQLIIENAKKAGGVIIEKLSAGFGNVLSLTVNFIFMAFTIFFLLKDGPDFFNRIREYIPFSEEQKDKLVAQAKDLIVSTIYGGVIVAIVQGILGGLSFLILGLGSPVLWGGVMAVMSFVPLFGTSIVWMPASLILIIQGAYLKGIALVFIGVFVISMVDNILKPLIIGGRTKMPTVIIFFSVLGGIKFFGLLGLVFGPLVFALLLSVLEIFRAVEEKAGG